MAGARDRGRDRRNVHVLAGWMVVGLTLFTAGVLLQVIGPAWTTEWLGHGRGSGSLSFILWMTGLLVILIGLPEAIHRILKGPQAPGRHSASD